MSISIAGAAAPDAISAANTTEGHTIAVAKKVLNNTKLEGQMAVRLIDNAGAPPPPTATRGNNVNTYA